MLPFGGLIHPLSAQGEPRAQRDASGGLHACWPPMPYVCAMSVHVCRGCLGAEMGFAARHHEEESVASPGSPQQRAKWLWRAGDIGDAAGTSNMPPRCLPLSFFLFSPFPLMQAAASPALAAGTGMGMARTGLGVFPASPPPCPAPGALWLPVPAGRGPSADFSSCLMVFYPPGLRGPAGKREDKDIRYGES